MRKKQELELLRTKNRILEENYQALSETYAANAQLYHDMNNHFILLQQLLDQGKYAQAGEYLRAVSEPVRAIAETVWTSVPIVDVVLNAKLALAGQRGIRMTVNAEYPHNAGIASDDLCVILTNLIDNALEAAAKEPDVSKRRVEVTIRRIPTFILIRIVNNAPVRPRRRFGLGNVAAAVKKYEGSLSLEYCEGEFEASAMLYF